MSIYSINQQLPVETFPFNQKTLEQKLNSIVKTQLIDWFYLQSGINPDINDIQVTKFQKLQSSHKNAEGYDMEFTYNGKTYETFVDEKGQIYSNFVNGQSILLIKEKLPVKSSEMPRKRSILKYTAGALALTSIAVAIFYGMNKDQTSEKGQEASNALSISKPFLNEKQQQLFDDFKKRIYANYHDESEDADFTILVEPRETCDGLGIDEPGILFQLNLDTPHVRGYGYEFYDSTGKLRVKTEISSAGPRFWRDNLSRFFGLNINFPSVCEN